MLTHLLDHQALLNVSIQHSPNEVDASRAHYPRYSQLAVKDLVHAVEWILFVYDSVEQDAERPHVLLLSAI